ncbi:hypothetical protein [Methanoregula sp.]|uniref:hypothetical protein n=1 Tax=Methanoregula sp. TaxID=2052170 RepID=UPI002370F031|nr:hypothetical protein [Methanoregula sp.]MDD1686777.1 hypothetical protein [Methanoregula sp.]
MEKRQNMVLYGVRTTGEIITGIMPVRIDHVAALTLEYEIREPATRESKALL